MPSKKKALASLGLCGREGSSSLPTGTARPENQGWGGQASPLAVGEDSTPPKRREGVPARKPKQREGPKLGREGLEAETVPQ